jgi:hypothetical protein
MHPHSLEQDRVGRNGESSDSKKVAAAIVSAMAMRSPDNWSTVRGYAPRPMWAPSVVRSRPSQSAPASVHRDRCESSPTSVFPPSPAITPFRCGAMYGPRIALIECASRDPAHKASIRHGSRRRSGPQAQRCRVCPRPAPGGPSRRCRSLLTFGADRSTVDLNGSRVSSGTVDDPLRINLRSPHTYGGEPIPAWGPSPPPILGLDSGRPLASRLAGRPGRAASHGRIRAETVRRR